MLRVLKEAREWLEHGLERLRSGFADGTLDPADMERGVGNLFSGAAEIMAERDGPRTRRCRTWPWRTRPTRSPGISRPRLLRPPGRRVLPRAHGDASRTWPPPCGSAWRTWSVHVLGRAEAAGYPDEQREAAAAEATALFAQAAERLENAVFNPGEGAPLDRAQLARFFQASFSALQGQILALLGDGPRRRRGAPPPPTARALAPRP